jgi:hypothetical protein
MGKPIRAVLRGLGGSNAPRLPGEGAEARLRAAHERVQQRANAGQCLPQSMGISRARARRPQSRSELKQEPILLLRRVRLEAWKERSEPPVLEPGESSAFALGDRAEETVCLIVDTRCEEETVSRTRQGTIAKA